MSIDIAKAVHNFSIAFVTNSLTIKNIFNKEEHWFSNFQEQGKSWKKGQPYLFDIPPPPAKNLKVVIFFSFVHFCQFLSKFHKGSIMLLYYTGTVKLST